MLALPLLPPPLAPVPTSLYHAPRRPPPAADALAYRNEMAGTPWQTAGARSFELVLTAPDGCEAPALGATLQVSQLV